MEVHAESDFPRNLTHKIPYVRAFHAIYATLRGDSKNIEDTNVTQSSARNILNCKSDGTEYW